MTLVTKRRVEALGMINRFNGWLDRPYSVLEHTVIGVTILKHEKADERIQKSFLFHDLEETEFGDIVRPVKKKYMKAQYNIAVREFNGALYCGHGLDLTDCYSDEVRVMDDRMLAAEIHTVARVTDRAHPYVERSHGDIATMIGLKTYGTHDLACAGFWTHYRRLFN